MVIKVLVSPRPSETNDNMLFYSTAAVLYFYRKLVVFDDLDSSSSAPHLLGEVRKKLCREGEVEEEEEEAGFGFK